MIPEGHKDPDNIIVGTILFDDLIEEKNIETNSNKFLNVGKGIGKCKVEIYGNEGIIPHMHIYNDSGFNTCVCLHSANYFSHSGKYKDKFNSNQCKEFNDWLSRPNSNTLGKLSNWEAILSMWTIMNPDCKFPEYRKVTKQPYYVTMTDFKDN